MGNAILRRALVWLAAMGLSVAAWAAEPVINILELHGSPLIMPGGPPPYAAMLEEQGLRVGFAGEDLHGTELTWERLKQFHVVMIPHLSSVHGINGPNVDISSKRFWPLLERFMEAGGGVLYIGQPILSQYPFHQDTNAWLKQFGAQIEWATIADADHTLAKVPPAPFQRHDYLYTTNIADSPITRGVKTIWYGNAIFYTPTIRPLTVSPDWQVLVSSMPSASTVPLEVTSLNARPERLDDQAKPGAAPLIAVRQVGKGRLAVFAADPGQYWFDLGKPALGEIVWKEGDGEHKPDWLPMLKNLCTWLSEPARQGKALGGEIPPTEFKVRPDYGNRIAFDWEKPDLAFSDDDLSRQLCMHSGWSPEDFRQLVAGGYRSWKFLVGARTALSGGKGSIADWKAAATAAGFDGVVFREDILSLTKEQWDGFMADCEAASDDAFVAVPGQQFTEWEGNTFMRFAWKIKYPDPKRLTPDGKAVRDQLAFFFDAGHPCNFPLSIKDNPAPWWSYRVHYGWPVALYRDGKRVEDNEDTWRGQVWNFQYPTPLGVHVIDDPAQVAATTADYHLFVLAPSLKAIRTSRRYQRALGTGEHNSMAAYTSNGPRIDAALPLNMYRATLGSRNVPGSYRWRFLIRAHSDRPITAVELWGGGQLLRRLQPNTTKVLTTIDDIHDRQRALLVKIIDADGRTALGTCFMVHDKMQAFYWCGDQCNTLPYGQGVDPGGNAAGFGITTKVRLKFSGGSGPGGGFYESWQYIPYGTDTSIPGLNVWASYRFATTAGEIPEPYVHLVSDTRFWYGCRDVLVHQENLNLWADRRIYTNEAYGHAYLSAWGRYFKMQPNTTFEGWHRDYDLHRDALEPGLQLCEGQLTFKQAVTLDATKLLNMAIGQNTPWVRKKHGVRTRDQVIEKSGKLEAVLGAGNYVTMPDPLGTGTVFALDDQFAVLSNVGGDGSCNVSWGYALGEKTFQPGDTFRYRYLIMRWPLGTPLESKLDEQVSRALNLGGPGGLRVEATQGKVVGTQLTTDLEAEDGLFRGRLPKQESPLRLPVRVRGVNPNWVAGVWYDGKAFLAPIAPDPDGWAWASLDPQAEAGEFVVGNLLTCDEEAVVLRLLQRLDGQWDVIAHNPTTKKLRTTVRGSDGGPVPGLKRKVTLQPGEEARWTVEL